MELVTVPTVVPDPLMILSVEEAVGTIMSPAESAANGE